jgi:hypothetical protein
MQAAEAFMRNGHAVGATVETAVNLLDTRFDLGLSADRKRMRGRWGDSGIRWEPTPPGPEERDALRRGRRSIAPGNYVKLTSRPGT